MRVRAAWDIAGFSAGQKPRMANVASQAFDSSHQQLLASAVYILTVYGIAIGNILVRNSKIS